MRVASLLSSSGSRTVFGKYLKQVKSDDRNNVGLAREVGNSFDSTSGAISDLKNKLSVLAKQAEKLKQTDAIQNLLREQLLGDSSSPSSPEGTESSGGTTPPPPQPSGGISISASSSKKTKKFERELQRALSNGYDSADDRLLKDSNLSGEVRVSIGAESFSIQVDGNTSVQDFVDALNSQSGGRIQASTVEINGKTRISLATPAVPPPPPAEGEAPAPTPPPSSQLLGEGSLKVSDFSGDIGELIQQLKKFAGTYNDLVGYVRRNGDGASLSETNVDESLVTSFRSVFKGSTGDQGRVAFDDFASFNSNGRITINEERIKESFMEDPEAVIEVFAELAKNVSGRQGVVRDYNARGGVFDQAVYAIAQSQLAKLDSLESASPQTPTDRSVNTEVTTPAVRSSLSLKA